MKRVLCIYLVAIPLFLSGCTPSEQWEGHVYPDRKTPLIHRVVSKSATLEECKEKSMGLLKNVNALETGYYECGKNCTEQSTFYQLKCEDKIRGNWYPGQ
jgi:hypothetical protein